MVAGNPSPAPHLQTILDMVGPRDEVLSFLHAEETDTPEFVPAKPARLGYVYAMVDVPLLESLMVRVNCYDAEGQKSLGVELSEVLGQLLSLMGEGGFAELFPSLKSLYLNKPDYDNENRLHLRQNFLHLIKTVLERKIVLHLREAEFSGAECGCLLSMSSGGTEYEAALAPMRKEVSEALTKTLSDTVLLMKDGPELFPNSKMKQPGLVVAASTFAFAPRAVAYAYGGGDVPTVQDDTSRFPIPVHELNTTNHYCAWTKGNGASSPGYWFVKFRDGEKHHVSRIRLWNNNRLESLNGACVRFSTDATMPSTASPTESNCDDTLPDIPEEWGGDSGTVVEINREITGMMFVTVDTANSHAINVCGIKIYKETARKMYTFDNTQLVPEQTSTHTEEPQAGDSLRVNLQKAAYRPLRYVYLESSGTQLVQEAADAAEAQTDKIAGEKGAWSFRFKDGEPHYVSAVKIWNRPDVNQGRLSLADVIFDDAEQPAFRLPNIAGTGTVVDISRTFTKLTLRNFAYREGADEYIYIMSVDGFHLYTPQPENKRALSVPYNVWDFEGEQGPGDYGSVTWTPALQDHVEDRSHAWSGSSGTNPCTHTSGGSSTNPSYWYARFKDGKKRRMAKMRLWNRAEGGIRLYGACVLFSTDGSKPTPRLTNCDLTLPNGPIDSDAGDETGLEVTIDRAISGIMITGNIADQRGWWKVTLPEPTFVTAMKLYNRPDCCQDQVDFSDVWLDDAIAFRLGRIAIGGTVVNIHRTVQTIMFKNEGRGAKTASGVHIPSATSPTAEDAYVLSLGGFQLYVPEPPPHLQAAVNTAGQIVTGTLESLGATISGKEAAEMAYKLGVAKLASLVSEISP
eukprot:g12355.t1